MASVNAPSLCAAILVRQAGLYCTEERTRKARWRKWARNVPDEQL